MVHHRRCRVLKKWLIRHGDTPYPSGLDKRLLAQRSNMTVVQVHMGLFGVTTATAYPVMQGAREGLGVGPNATAAVSW